MLPLSLSYDHRIIDGAEAARFNNDLKENLGNRVISIDDIYGDAKFIESQAFAYLGIRRIKNLPISLPGTTGVKSPITGGKIT